MSVLAFHDQGYAGFKAPSDVVSDTALSVEQKIETLRHWQRTIMRLARLAPPSEREAFEYLIIELAVSIDAIDRASIDQAQDRPLS